MKKYRPLGDHLVKQSEVSVSLTFQEIERILGFSLPPSAYSHRAWWANSLSHPQAGSWLNVGWKVSKVNIEQKTALLIRPLILSIHKVIENGEAFSLTATMDAENIAFILSGPAASATSVYSWRQIVQMLMDANPQLFGNLTRQPDHHIFPEMLAKLGYTVVNWETGESWKAKKGKGTTMVDDFTSPSRKTRQK
jgi:hypothetical protein